jgi:hypothetical protein
LKEQKGFPVVVYVLLGLLALGALSITLNNREGQAFPSASSVKPSGTRALFELLRAQGYKVETTQLPRPKLEPGDTLVAFSIEPRGIFDDQASTRLMDRESRNELYSALRSGTNAVVFFLSPDFREASKAALEDTKDVQWAETSKHFKVTAPSDEAPELEAALPRITKKYSVLAKGADDVLAEVSTATSGKLMYVRNGIFVTNRFLDKQDNAAAAVALVRGVAPAGGRVLFYERSFGNGSEPGLLETLGPWALAGWYQAIFLFIVVCYTLGKPFGLPEEARFRQSGSRELVEAVAQTYQRAQATDIALQSVYDQADRDLRHRLKLPKDATRAERDRLLPQPLVSALADVYVSLNERIPISEALNMAEKLDIEMSSYLGRDRKLRKRRRNRQ